MSSKSTNPHSTLPSNKPTLPKLSISDFHVHRLLGEGAYGKVLLAESKKTQKQYAIKSIDKFFLSKLNKIHEAFIEREMLSSILSHPNIPKLITSFQSQDKLYYVLPYFKNGSLQDLLSSTGPLSYGQAQFYLAQLVNILEYFESKQIAHLDMKPHNMLIDDDNNLKLIDFATATQIGCEYDLKRKAFTPKHNKRIEMVGTVEYASPEMLRGNVVNEKSCDLWALGVIMYQMFYGYTPFKGESQGKTKENILKNEIRINEDIGKVVNDLILCLLRGNYKERIGFNGIAEIKAHSFFDGVDFSNLNYNMMCCCSNVFWSFGSNMSGDYNMISQRETCYSDNCMDSCEEEDEKEEMEVKVVIEGNGYEIMKIGKHIDFDNNYIRLCKEN